jgi:hypothetical protein
MFGVSLAALEFKLRIKPANDIKEIKLKVSYSDAFEKLTFF